MEKKFVTVEQLKKTANNLLKKVRDKGYSTGGGGEGEIIDYGSAYKTLNSQYRMTISFNKTFTKTPTVVCNLIRYSTDTTAMYIRIYQRTDTYFVVELFKGDGTQYKGTSYFSISWFAIGT